MIAKSLKLFEAIFENSPVGLVLLNEDTTIRDVNKYMLEAFQMTEQIVKGRRFGNVFNCVAVSEQGAICGQTEICKSCDLRNGITSVLKDGDILAETLIHHNFYINNTEQQKWLKVSASRISEGNDTFAVVSFSDITTTKEYEALLTYQFSLDMSTQVINKYALLNTLKSFVLNVEFITLALIDYDRLETINNVYGHTTGDKVLSMFCSSASANTRSRDTIWRFGGDEFLLIFPETFASQTIDIIKRISNLTRSECVVELGIDPTFSVGLVELTKGQISNLEVSDMIALVEANLHEAKKRGKNTIFAGGFCFPFKPSRQEKSIKA